MIFVSPSLVRSQARLSRRSVGALVDALGAYRAASARRGTLGRRLCGACSASLREDLAGAAARAAFALGYACVRTDAGVANAHQIVGVCAHAQLFALAFEDVDKETAASGWGVAETAAWALVQLLTVAKRRTTARALVQQLRQLGLAKACTDILLAPRRRGREPNGARRRRGAAATL